MVAFQIAASFTLTPLRLPSKCGRNTFLSLCYFDFALLLLYFVALYRAYTNTKSYIKPNIARDL